jgi:hypothetical protein
MGWLACEKWGDAEHHTKLFLMLYVGIRLRWVGHWDDVSSMPDPAARPPGGAVEDGEVLQGAERRPGCPVNADGVAGARVVDTHTGAEGKAKALNIKQDLLRRSQNTLLGGVLHCSIIYVECQ